MKQFKHMFSSVTFILEYLYNIDLCIISLSAAFLFVFLHIRRTRTFANKMKINKAYNNVRRLSNEKQIKHIPHGLEVKFRMNHTHQAQKNSADY